MGGLNKSEQPQEFVCHQTIPQPVPRLLILWNRKGEEQAINSNVQSQQIPRDAISKQYHHLDPSGFQCPFFRYFNDVCVYLFKDPCRIYSTIYFVELRIAISISIQYVNVYNKRQSLAYVGFTKIFIWYTYDHKHQLFDKMRMDHGWSWIWQQTLSQWPTACPHSTPSGVPLVRRAGHFKACARVLEEKMRLQREVPDLQDGGWAWEGSSAFFVPKNQTQVVCILMFLCMLYMLWYLHYIHIIHVCIRIRTCLCIHT